MTKMTYSVTEARDHILKRIGSEGSSNHQTVVLDLLNRGMAYIASMHDWIGLIKTSTFTTSDATGIVSLDAEIDRILTIHASGEDYMLEHIHPLEFEQIKEGASFTVPKVWTDYGQTRDTDTESPKMQIQIYAAPASGTTYTIRYIKHVDEMSAGDSVPYVPTHIWELAQRWALVEAMKYVDMNHSSVNTEENAFFIMLQRYIARESFGSSRHSEIRRRADVSNYYAGRKK